MNPRIRRALAVNAVWVVGFLLAIGGLALRSVAKLEHARGGVESLEHRIEQAQALVDLKLAEQAAIPPGASAADRLDDWAALTASQSSRVAELSRAAQRAGVQLAKMRSFEPRRDEETGVLNCAHEITAVGSFREIGRFLSSVQDAPGRVSIEDLVISRQADERAGELEPGAATPVLRAAMWVRWYAAAPEAAGGQR